MALLPGHTELNSYNKPTPYRTDNKKSILLATNEVNYNTLFLNGLNQNILILYKLFIILGHECHILCNKKVVAGNITGNSNQTKEYNIITSEVLLHSSIPIDIFIEMGMSISHQMRSHLKNNNAKIVKLYLGNILNIDIETVQNMPNIFFNHHTVGNLDEIWTSPHYGQNLEYGSILNRCQLSKGRIAPYVWEPFFIEGAVMKQWEPYKNKNETSIVIFDPTISFQKSYLYSLIIAEKYAEINKEWKGNVIIINGDRIFNMEHNRYNIIKNLNLYRQNRIEFKPRKTILEILKEYNSSIFINYQYNNDFNYATLELIYSGYPLLHNSEGWKHIGYNYSNESEDDIIKLLHNALYFHEKNMNKYIAESKVLYWKHSIYNPENQRDWQKLLCESNDCQKAII